MKVLPLVALFFVLQGSAWRSYQRRLEDVAKDTAPAVMAILSANVDHPGIRGAAFLVNNEGYFLTAAHLLAEYEPNSAHLAVILRNKDGNGSGRRFDVIEKDDDLDVALCRMSDFDTIQKMRTFELGTVHLSSQFFPAGHLVVIAGFPVGVWGPTIQAGHIATDHTIGPPGGMSHLFQVSVAGNQGDSGGPVIDLETGKVIGIIVSGSVNALTTEQGVSVQSAGLLYAVPISKVSELLARHHIQIDHSRNSVPTIQRDRAQ